MAPHAIEPERRRSSSNRHSTSSSAKLKFPELTREELQEVAVEDVSRDPTPDPPLLGSYPSFPVNENWQPRHDSRANGRNSWTKTSLPAMRHGRQKSLSEAIRTVRTRKMSMSENAHEIADALKAPISFKLVLLCGVWYATSILTNTSSKAILTALPRPVTLTVVQFLLVSFWCLFLSWLAKHNSTVRTILPVLKGGVRRPTREIIIATLPLTAFQIGGHILNSDAMTRIPVSLVHTIKGLSPLMTVVAYRVFFRIRYSVPTYLSLIPLTLGVVMACSASFRGNLIGLAYAFGSAILFVTQNIVSKTIFNESAKAEADGTPISRRKPDKLNLLCYSSAMAFLFTFPIWLWSEGLPIAADFFHDGSIDLSGRPGALDHGPLFLEFVFNGTFHFGQSLVAFVLLGMVSPVTYSVASLIKRVVVIMFAIVWFGNSMTRIQASGFGLTFLGLYLYDRISDADRADRQARERTETSQSLLPLSVGGNKKSDAFSLASVPEDIRTQGAEPFHSVNAGGSGCGPGHSRTRAGSRPSSQNNVTIASLLPGTKAEHTWGPTDFYASSPR